MFNFLSRKYDTEEVYGVSNDIIKSYIERSEVDEKFKKSIKQDKAIIIYGSSKQGKTSLIQKHLDENSYLKIECSPSTRLIDIYQSIIRQNNIELKIESEIENTRSDEGKISVKAIVKVPLIFEGEVTPEYSHGTENKSIDKFQSVEYNLSLPQSIIEILKAHNIQKYIVLENFHYLSEEEQRTFAFDLRTFQDNSVLFIILGIWRERNRLSQFNGDLQDRMIEIPVEPWDKNDFIKVIKLGERYLKVSFDDIISEIIEASFDSIGVLQELAKNTCYAAKIFKTSHSKQKLTLDHLNISIKTKLDDYSTRHNKSFESFIDNTYGANKVELYKLITEEEKRKYPLYIPNYFIMVLLSSEFQTVINGFDRKMLHDSIRAKHYRPEDVRAGDMSNFLHNIIATQIQKKISPPLFDYDGGSKKLKIIDSTLYFYLKHSNKEDIITDLDL